MKIILTAACCLGLSTSAHAQVTPRFNHVAFAVTELDRSTRFYQQVIGLDTIPEPFKVGRHRWFKLSEQGALHLIQGNRLPVSIKESHLCLSVPDLDAMMQRLRRLGLPFESWTGEKNQFTRRTDGVRQIYLQDPDGYWLELNDER
jgi:lactoylglutathione lyase